MSISDRQLELIKEGAELLISETRLTKEEAITLISSSLKKELQKRNTTMEALNLSTKPDRTSFIRSVVQHLLVWNPRKPIMENKKYYLYH